MSFVHTAVDFAKKHPYEIGGGLAAVVVLFLVTRHSGSSTPQYDPQTTLALARLQSNTTIQEAKYAAQAQEAPSQSATAQAADAAQANEAQSKYGYLASAANAADALKSSLAQTAASVTGLRIQSQYGLKLDTQNNEEQYSLNTANNQQAYAIGQLNASVQNNSIYAQMQTALQSLQDGLTENQNDNATQSSGIAAQLQAALAQIAGNTTDVTDQQNDQANVNELLSLLTGSSTQYQGTSAFTSAVQALLNSIQGKG